MDNTKITNKIIFILGSKYGIFVEDEIKPILGYNFINETFNLLFHLVVLPEVYWFCKSNGSQEILYELNTRDNTLQVYEI